MLVPLTFSLADRCRSEARGIPHIVTAPTHDPSQHKGYDDYQDADYDYEDDEDYYYDENEDAQGWYEYGA